MVCRATMEQAAAQNRWKELHEAAPWHDGTFKSWAAERSRLHPFHYADGTQIVVSPVDLGLGGDFLKYESRDAGLGNGPTRADVADGVDVPEVDAGGE